MEGSLTDIVKALSFINKRKDMSVVETKSVAQIIENGYLLTSRCSLTRRPYVQQQRAEASRLAAWTPLHIETCHGRKLDGFVGQHAAPRWKIKQYMPNGRDPSCLAHCSDVGPARARLLQSRSCPTGPQDRQDTRQSPTGSIAATWLILVQVMKPHI